MDSLRYDVRRALRALRRSPRLTVTVVTTLALGIGVVTAFFSLVDALLFRPLPYDEPEELVRLQEQSSGQRQFAVSPEVYQELRETDFRSLEGVARYESTRVNLAGADWTEAVQGARVSPEFLPLLGVRPRLGRLPGAQEVYAGTETVVVLGHDLWVRRFEGDPDVLDETVRLDGAPVRVVGVMPEGFVFPEFGEIWAPITDPDLTGQGTSGGVRLLARLAEGATPEAARRELSTFATRLAEAGVISGDASLSLWSGVYVRSRGLDVLPWIFLVAAGFVLLIVCSNIAALLLARGARRRGETAVRGALGASRARLLRETLLEGGVLALFGGLLGVLVSVVVLDLFLGALGANFPLWFDPGVDLRVLAFTLVTSGASVLAFGLPPALEGSRVDPARHLSGGGPGVAVGGRSRKLRKGLIVSQVGLAFVLVVGGALMAKSVNGMTQIETGVDDDEVYRVWVSLRGGAAGSEVSRRDYFARAASRLRSALGAGTEVAIEADLRNVRGLGERGDTAALADSLRLAPVVASGGEELRGREVRSRVVSPNYFSAVGLELLRGRSFGSGDVVGAPVTGVLSETLATRLWPSVAPLGRTLRLGGLEGIDVRIVGVVEDQRSLHTGGAGGMSVEAEPYLYLPEAQTVAYNRKLLVRPGPASPTALASTVRSELRALDPGQAVSAVETLGASTDALTRGYSSVAALLVALAGAGGILAALGLYGLISQSVAERTREIGIRRALGGTTRRIVVGVLGDGLRLTGAGVLVGSGFAFLLTRVLRSFLYGVEPYDPVVLLGAALFFGGVGWAASHLPARRAAAVEPMEALRVE